MKRAVALSYSEESGKVPVVVAKGKEAQAYRMLNEALRHDIPVVTDPELTLLLDQLKTGSEIPDNLYRAVASVFVFLIMSGQRR